MRNVLLALLAVSSLASAHDNWTSQAGIVVNSTGLCWRSSAWTPATAAAECDGAIKPAVPVNPALKAEAERPRAKPAQVLRVTYLSRTLFDFDRAVLKPEGRKAMDQLIGRLSSVNVEVVIATGHTDSVGSDRYNLDLGMRRAEAVRNYLVSKGLEPGRVYVDSKGEREPVASNKTAEERGENRRVVVEVYGSDK
jgi:OmpA-OmpF porin, OOP family